MCSAACALQSFELEFTVTKLSNPDGMEAVYLLLAQPVNFALQLHLSLGRHRQGVVSVWRCCIHCSCVVVCAWMLIVCVVRVLMCMVVVWLVRVLAVWLGRCCVWWNCMHWVHVVLRI